MCTCTRDMMEYQLLVDCRIPLWNGMGLYGTSDHVLDTLSPYSRTCTMERHGTVWYIPPCTGHCLSMYPGMGYGTSHHVPETGVAHPLSQITNCHLTNRSFLLLFLLPHPSFVDPPCSLGKKKRVYTCTLLDT